MSVSSLYLHIFLEIIYQYAGATFMVFGSILEAIVLPSRATILFSESLSSSLWDLLPICTGSSPYRALPWYVNWLTLRS